MPLERRQESADLNYPPFEIESVVLDTLEPISSPQEVLEIRDMRIFPTFSSLKVAEEREYQCLGEWMEDGVLYTYTRRKDIDGYECFVGQTNSQGIVYLAESGSDCRRGVRVQAVGMALNRRSSCFEPSSDPPFPVPGEDIEPVVVPGDIPGVVPGSEPEYYEQSTRRPWLPIFGDLSSSSSPAASFHSSLSSRLRLTLVSIFVILKL